MARGGDRTRDDDVPAASGELDSAFRDAVLQPWRAAPRPAPRAAAGSPDDRRHEIQALHDELDVQRLEFGREREAWTAERLALLARVAELEARAGETPALAELARGVDGLTDRIRSLAERPGTDT